ncbi:hypothetical protein TrST_g10382 [Triparma strigata]|uniref:C2 domain-containing protein n=1 Tax=Triparma strigata TaxID=1606541 RepID=A0A9W7C9J5_9STRA|nr:hypothetical protein TrST_g10382 [Triparma strigata]
MVKQPPVSLNVCTLSKKKSSPRRNRLTLTCNGTKVKFDFGRKNSALLSEFLTKFSWYKFESSVTTDEDIQIDVVGCTGLALTDVKTSLSGSLVPSKPDPYVVIRSNCENDGTVFHRTKHLQNSCNPIFTSATESSVMLKKDDVMRAKQGGGLIVEVFDFDRIGNDDLLGTAFVPFGLLLFDKDRVEFPLKTPFEDFHVNKPPPMVMIGFKRHYNHSSDIVSEQLQNVPDCRSPARAVSLDKKLLKSNSSEFSVNTDSDFMSADGSSVNNSVSSFKSPRFSAVSDTISKVRKNIVKTTKVTASAITPSSTRRVSKSGEVLLKVKPYADKSSDQRWLTKSSLQKNALEHSARFTPVKPLPPAAGLLHIEALYANSLPNRDGGTLGKFLGKLTDAFVCFVVNDSFATTCVVDNCLNPIWPSWENRAFTFPLYSSSRIVHVGVFDSDRGDILGGFDYDAVGRSYISLAKLREGMEYTLELKLGDSTTYVTEEERGKKGRGTLAVRVRVEWGQKGPRGAMLYDTIRICQCYFNGTAGLDDSERSLHVRDERDYAMVQYCVEGSRVGSTYNIKTVYAMVDEVKSLSVIFPLLFIAARSLILWRRPSQSIVILCVSWSAVNEPNLIPAAFAFLLAFALIVLNGNLASSANPFKRPRTHLQMLKILLLNRDDRSDEIGIGEGATLDAIHEKEKQRAISDVWREWKNFVDKKIRENQEYNDMLAAMEVDYMPGDGPTIKIKGVLGSVVDPVSAVLSPIQTALHPILCYVRLMKNVILGNEPNLNFLLTLMLLLSSILLSIFPFGLIFRVCGKFVVILVLGPQNMLLGWVLNSQGAVTSLVPPIFYSSGDASIDDDELISTGVLPLKPKPEGYINEFNENKRAVSKLRVQQEKILKVRDEKIKKEGKIILKKFSLNVERFEEYPVSEGSASEACT